MRGTWLCTDIAFSNDDTFHRNHAELETERGTCESWGQCFNRMVTFSSPDAQLNVGASTERINPSDIKLAVYLGPYPNEHDRGQLGTHLQFPPIVSTP